LVSLAPGSCFTVCVNLQAHATAFKATLAKKNCLKVTLTIQTHLIYVEHFSYPNNLGSTPRCPKHQGVILKVQYLCEKAKNTQNGPRTSLMGPGEAD